MANSYWTVQDAHGIYNFKSPGVALGALLSDLTVSATMFDPSGFRVAGVSIQGVYSATQSFAIMLERAGTEQEYAVIVAPDGLIYGAPLGTAPLAAYLQHGWVAE
jgi:hypothetical protein